MLVLAGVDVLTALIRRLEGKGFRSPSGFIKLLVLTVGEVSSDFSPDCLSDPLRCTSIPFTWLWGPSPPTAAGPVTAIPCQDIVTAAVDTFYLGLSHGLTPRDARARAVESQDPSLSEGDVVVQDFLLSTSEEDIVRELDPCVAICVLMISTVF